MKTIAIILGLYCLGCGPVGNGRYQGPAPGTLAFSVQPSTTVAGEMITPAVQVLVQDSRGNTVTSASTSITVALGTNPAGGTLSGTATVTAVNGVATFSNLSLDMSGTGYTLTADATDLTGATSSPFDVVTPPKLAFRVQPSTTAAGVAITPAVQVVVQDGEGNTVTSASTSITVAIGTNPAHGTLSGTATVAAVNGVATFSNLSVDHPGAGYTLTASSTGLTGATSVPFNVLGVSFQAVVEYPNHGAPWSVAVGDFNADGKWDLAVVNFGSEDVSVWLGNGNGTFHYVGNFAAGHSPWSVAVGDFNGDGVPDLAVANSGTVSILLGNGDGTFQAPMRFATTGGHPNSVAVGDFDGDEKLDLAVVNGNGSAIISVLLGNGDGTFQAAQNFATGRDPDSVAVGDFNGDGKLDIVAANDSGTVSVLLGNGDGTFQAAQNFAGGGAFASLAVGDFNGDTVVDLAISYHEGVSVLLGNGDGTFQEARHFAAGIQPWSVAVGDFNADGVPDLAVANLGACGDDGCAGSGVSVLLGNGDGTFQAAVNFAAGGGPRSVTTADFNADGLPDLAVAHSIPSGLSVLINNTRRQ